MTGEFTPFFNPKGVVIVGASSSPEKLGYGLARNLDLSGYQGGIHYVNPKGGELFGRKIYPSINLVPGPVDLAVLLVQSKFVPQALEEIGQRGIKAVIIAAGGFKEIGPEGEVLENESMRIANKYSIRVIGPNCIGLLDTHLPINTTFLSPPGPEIGDIAFVSHSGAICAAIIDWSKGQGFGFSRLISLGNQADVNETDLLPIVAADEHTKVITLYLEGIQNGSDFVEVAKKISKKKPIVALKVGRFEGGKKAVASHTGALAGREVAFDAAFERAGVFRAESTEEMFVWAGALAWCPLPAGRNVAILTNAGGPGVIATDAIESNGLRIAKMAKKSVGKLKTFLPAYSSFNNPVDILASASPADYSKSLIVLLEDQNVDSVIVILPPPPMFTAAEVVNALIPIIQKSSKPVVIALMGETLIQEAAQSLREAHIVEYRFPEQAASALAVLSSRAEWLGLKDNTPTPEIEANYRAAKKALTNAKLSPEGFLAEEDARKIFEAYQLPIVPLLLASTKEDCKRVADKLGYPLVMKIASQDIPHKTDVGGVTLNIVDQSMLLEEFDKMLEKVSLMMPKAAIDGVLLQPMLTGGQEVIVGAVQDPQFGPLLMFGSGGTEVEGLEDVSFCLSSPTKQEINELFENTWAGKKLKGFRNLTAADQAAVSDVLIRIAKMAEDFPELIEIEINPLLALKEGSGAFAIDYRIKMEKYS